MFDITTKDLIAVYEHLKDQYELTLTNSFAVDDGFESDCPLLLVRAHDMILWLYEYGGDFVLDVMDAEQTKGTHWHPISVDSAIDDIVEFMEGKSDYEMYPFKQNEMFG